MVFRKTIDRMLKAKSPNRQAGNAILMLFAAIGMAGIMTYGLNVVMRGPAMTTADISRRTIAENNLVATSRMAVSAATNQVANGGDCDGDGFVEPLPYRDAGVLAHPTGGGFVPATVGASMTDPWGTQYGYCVWDPGTASVSDNVVACGGNTAKRLQGAPREDQPAIAIISAGKNGTFETTCNAYVDANADRVPDTAMIVKGAGSDDIVLPFSYAEANGIGGGMWKLKAGDSTTATIGKNIEVTGSGKFSGAVSLQNKGLVLPGDPGDNSVTGACSAAKDQQMRRNTTTSPPTIEICDFTGSGNWVAVSGTGASTSCTISSMTSVNIVTTNGVASAATSGNYMYYVNRAASGQLSVINISNPSAPTVIATTVADSTKMNAPTSIALSGNYVYVANNGSGGITTVDVSNPSAPAIAGGGSAYMTHANLADIKEVKIVGNYLATTEQSGNRFTVVDVSNPLAPSVANSGNATIQDSTKLSYSRGLAVKGNYAFVVASNGKRLTTIDMTNPLSPTIVGSVYDATYLNAASSIAISGNYAVVGSIGTGWVSIFDISTPSAPTLVGKIQDATKFDYVSAIEIVGKYAFIKANWGISALDIGDVVNPTIAASLSQGSTSLSGLGFKDQYLFKNIDTTAGVRSINLGCNPANSGAPGDAGAPDLANANVNVIPDPIDSGLIAYWKFDEGSGTTVSDSAGTNTGTFVNTPIWVDGVNGGKALSFNMADRDAVQVSGLLGQPQNLTIAGWVNNTATDTTSSLVLSIGNYVTMDAQNSALFYWNGSAWNATYGNSFLVRTGWHYMVGTFDTTNHVFAMYLDGVMTARTTTTDNIVWTGKGANTYIAQNANAGTDQDFDGAIDDLRVYNRALGPAEVSKLYLREKSRMQIKDPITDAIINDSYRGKVSAGDGYGTCAIKPDKTLWCWGVHSAGPYFYSDAPSRIRDTTITLNYLTSTASDIPSGYAISSTTTGTNISVGVPIALTNSIYFYSANGAITNVGDSPFSVAIQLSAADTLVYGSAYVARVNSQGQMMSQEFQVGPELAFTSNILRYSGNADLGVWNPTDRLRVRVAFRNTDTVAKTLAMVGATATQITYSTVESTSNSSWEQVSYGETHTCGIKSDGSIWCWGLNTNKQAGNGTAISYKYPVQITQAGPWAKVDAGSLQTCALKMDGSAWCWGANGSGQLGINSTTDSNPTTVSGGAAWLDISTGYNHSCGIKTDGTAWCWGDDTYGQLGNGATTGVQTVPSQVSDIGPWVSISAGLSMTCGIKIDGSGWCWGRDNNGQLGNGNIVTADQTVPSPLGGGYNGDIVSGFPSSRNGPWTQISLGGKGSTGFTNTYSTACGLKADGSAWCWGRNMFGQYGNGNQNATAVPSRVNGGGTWAAIDVGLTSVCGMKTDGGLYCWGTDNNYELGNGAAVTGMQTSPYPVTGWPNPSLFSFNDDAGAILANAGLRLYNSILSNDVTGAPIGFGFTSPGRGFIAQTTDNNQLLLETSAANSSSQIAFKTAAGSTGTFAGLGNSVSWTLNDTASTATASSAGYNGTLSSGAIWTTNGKVSGALTLNAAKEAKVSIPRATLVEPAKLNLSFWVKISGQQNDGAPIVAKEDTVHSGTGYSYAVTLNGNSHHQLAFVTGYTGGNHTLQMNGIIPDETWTYVVVTYDPTAPTDQKKIYINGVLNAVATETHAILYDTSSAINLYFGYRRSCTACSFNGALDHVIISDNIWSESQILDYYRLLNTPAYTSVVGMSYATNDFRFARTTTSPTPWIDTLTPTMTITSSGKVGIGGTPQASLDIAASSTNAGMRVGTDAVCSANNAGAMRYNGALASTVWDYCNGTAWTAFTVNAFPWSKKIVKRKSLGLSLGTGHSCGTRVDGKSWCWGSNTNGWLGNGTTTAQYHPVLVQTSTGPGSWADWISISAGNYHSCGLRVDGTIWCWGVGGNGRLGNGASADTSRPVQVQTSTGPGGWTDWSMLSSGGYHSCGLRTDGTAWCWGYNGNGRLGDGTTTDQTRPIQVQTDTGPGGWADWTSIVSGAYRTCGIRVNGTAWCWGRNADGQLGNGGSTDQYRPVQVQTDTGPGGWSDWVSLTAGDSDVCGIRSNGTAWCWGYNGNSRLGNGNNTSQSRPVQVQTDTGPGGWADWISISAGNFHTCGLRTDGTLWCWGGNSNNQLGNGNTTDQSRPVQVQTDTGPGGWADWATIATGDSHSCGVRTNGTLWCWGYNSTGQLGNDTTTSQPRPIKVQN